MRCIEPAALKNKRGLGEAKEALLLIWRKVETLVHLVPAPKLIPLCL